MCPYRCLCQPFLLVVAKHGLMFVNEGQPRFYKKQKSGHVLPRFELN